MILAIYQERLTTTASLHIKFNFAISYLFLCLGATHHLTVSPFQSSPIHYSFLSDSRLER